MCTERRAHFQKVERQENGETRVSYSVRLTEVQLWISIAALLLTFATTLGGGVIWAKSEVESAVKGVAIEVFNDKLDKMHAVMKPELYTNVQKMIDHSIDAHTIEIERPFERRLDQIESRITKMEASQASELAATRRDILRLETKIDRLLEK